MKYNVISLEAVMTMVSSGSGHVTGSMLGAFHGASSAHYREDIMPSWWCMPVTSALRRQRHKNHGWFEASQDYIARHYLKKEERWGAGCRRDD